LDLPDVDTTVYVVPYKVVAVSKDLKIVTISSEIYKGKVTADSYYLFAFVVEPSSAHVEVTPGMLEKYPALRQ
jgi:hypothetical protein